MKLLRVVIIVLISAAAVSAQRGSTLFGDVKIDESGVAKSAPPKVMIVLYRDLGGEVGRQPISNGSRYTFPYLREGEYQLAIEIDNNEVTRIRVTIQWLSSDPRGFRQDLDFALKATGPATTNEGVISAADVYDRPVANRPLFDKAQDAAGKKKYDQAADFLKQIVDKDSQDFQALTLLGTVLNVQNKPAEAEDAYLKALAAKPTFFLALIDLGRLRSGQKNYEGAVEMLTRAVEVQAQSGEANLVLGEAYLQLKKGSKAIPYMNAA